MALQVTSCTLRNQPTRLLEKGPDYFKRRTNARIFAEHRKSAVELLEASKSDYVKSTFVLNHRQELRHPNQLQLGSRQQPLTTSHPKRAKSEHDLLLCQKSFDKEFKTDHVKNFGEKHKIHTKRKILISGDGDVGIVPSKHEQIKINISASGVKNVRSNSQSTWPLSSENKPVITKDSNAMDGADLTDKEFFSPVNCQSLSTSVTLLVEQRCSGAANSAEIESDRLFNYRKKPIHRSNSDLSCRHSQNSSEFSDICSRLSRTSTELERFFSEMGLDRSVLDPMLKLQDSQLVKGLDALESTSSLGSPARSFCSPISHNSKDNGVGLHEGSSTNLSVVERNARIIKWLCNVRKAQVPPTTESSRTVPILPVTARSMQPQPVISKS